MIPHLTLAIVLGTAGALAAQDSRPTSRPTSRPSADAEAPPKIADGSFEALDLAERVKSFAGGDEALAQVENVTFTFAGGRRHFWDLREGRVRTESPARGNRPGSVVVYDLNADKVLLGGGENAEGAARRARGAWINDTYWLLVPLKVLDAGVTLSIDEPGDEDEIGVARLRLRFEEVGFTPQNEYVLHVEEETGKVLRWDYYATADAQPRSWEFKGYTQVGPLHLSLERPSVGGRGALRLEDVEVNTLAPEDIWDASEPILLEER